MKQAGSLINFLPVCFADQNLSNQRIKSLLNFNTSKDIVKSQAHIGIIEIQMKLFGYLFYMINDIVAACRVYLQHRLTSGRSGDIHKGFPAVAGFFWYLHVTFEKRWFTEGKTFLLVGTANRAGQ